ncbi:hypothetical protein ACQUY5_31980 [Bacillus cereus]|uniref:hypothetical protein n=1 Tax=Bacillus cereus TaxID=1396 RepID=UPI003D17886B
MNILLCMMAGVFVVSGALVLRTALKHSKIDILETSFFGLSGIILLIGLVMTVIKG